MPSFQFLCSYSRYCVDVYKRCTCGEVININKSYTNTSRIRTNDELQVTYTDIVTTIKVRILESAGHLVRMTDDRTVKKVFQGNRRKTKIKVVKLY